MHSLYNNVLLFFRVASFKIPPQELPATDKVLASAIILSLLVGVLRYFIVGGEYYSIFRVLVELLVPGVLIYALLLFFKLQNRFVQTFAAVCGSGAIIYAFALPVFPSFHASANQSQYGLSVFLIILLDLWSVAVLAFILKHAVNVGFATGISLAVALVLLTLMLVESISPSKSLSQGAELSSINISLLQARSSERHSPAERFGHMGGTIIDSIATAPRLVSVNLSVLPRTAGPL